jgi:hypothetical protein
MIRGHTSIITFSDGQTVDSAKITRATLLGDAKRLLVETVDGPIKIAGGGVEDDAALLNAVRDKEKRHFLVHRK